MSAVGCIEQAADVAAPIKSPWPERGMLYCVAGYFLEFPSQGNQNSSLFVRSPMYLLPYIQSNCLSILIGQCSLLIETTDPFISRDIEAVLNLKVKKTNNPTHRLRNHYGELTA